MDKTALIIGATSGIGRELARQLAAQGYRIAATGRREKLLESLRKQLGPSTLIQPMDVRKPEQAVQQMEEMVKEAGDVDLIILNAGIGFLNPDFEWEKDASTIETNVLGFTAVADWAAKYFMKRKSGQLVGISSVSAIRGGLHAPSYHASKAYMSSFLEGLRLRFKKEGLPITVTDIRPGYVNTGKSKGPNLFWVAEVDEAVRQMVQAILARKKRAYITRRWKLIALAAWIAPDWVLARS